MVVLLTLATQSSSDVTDFSEVNSTPLGTQLRNLYELVVSTSYGTIVL